MPAPDAISSEQLARLLGTPKAPVILDVRRDDVRAGDPRQLPTAVAIPESDVSPHYLARIAAETAQPIVVVCAEGHRLSQGTAAWLRHEGAQAEYLLGGQVGWAAAGLPLIDPRKITARDALGRSVWVTRSRPKIDRIACPWLIRRFIDPQAVFLFVAPAEVPGVAERFGAIPFDITDVTFSHRGDLCSFDVFLSEFGLSTPALDRLAQIVRGADTGRLDLAPECAGLLAALLGLSRVYSDDLAQLDAGMTLFDAFYRWARDATDERHNWPNQNGKPA